MIIDYVPPWQIYPCNGISYPKKNKVVIRNDWTGQKLLAIIAHERYHLTDASTNVFWREVKANAYSAWKHPAGFILAAILTIWHFRQTIDYFKWVKRGKKI